MGAQELLEILPSDPAEAIPIDEVIRRFGRGESVTRRSIMRLRKWGVIHIRVQRYPGRGGSINLYWRNPEERI